MVSVSIYIYRFAALLADVVALAVGAVVCAGRFLALEFNYTFNRGVVSAVLVAVGVIGCGLAVERGFLGIVSFMVSSTPSLT